MNKKILIGLTIIIIVLAGCIQPPVPKPESLDDSQATEPGIKETVKGNNQFAIEMYSELNTEGKNLFFSPWSISSALAMTFEGAKGQTAEEMKSVLHFQENDLDRRSSFAKIFNSLNKENTEFELSTANALWAQKDYPFLESYVDTTKKYYSAEFTNMDFVNKTEESRKTINSWVEEKTNNKIKNLIPQGSIDSLTRMVLTNAIYFKGDWETQFDKTKTKKEDFKVNETTTVQADMMSLKKGEEEFNYGETEELQIIEMPYKGKEISMIVLLPKNSLQETESMLSPEKLDEWKKLMHKKDVYVYFPKFTFETEYSLNEKLAEMGMPTAFSENNADFTGMFDSTKTTENLFISQVIHKAFVKVDEEGTEAAAATAVVMGATSAMPDFTEFRADHPFIFLIQENSTGSILFIGKVADPTI
ncbi:MAG: serpin family protein [archaeon]